MNDKLKIARDALKYYADAPWYQPRNVNSDNGAIARAALKALAALDSSDAQAGIVPGAVQKMRESGFLVEVMPPIAQGELPPSLLDALKAMLQEKEDYMLRNNLGNPNLETTNKMARAAIAAHEAGKGQEPVTPLKDITTIRKWAEQIDRMAVTFTDEKSLLCQQASILLHRIAYTTPPSTEAAVNAALEKAAKLSEDDDHRHEIGKNVAVSIRELKSMMIADETSDLIDRLDRVLHNADADRSHKEIVYAAIDLLKSAPASGKGGE